MLPQLRPILEHSAFVFGSRASSLSSVRGLFLTASGLPINYARKEEDRRRMSLADAFRDAIMLGDVYPFLHNMRSETSTPDGKQQEISTIRNPFSVAMKFVSAMEAQGVDVVISGSLARSVLTVPRTTKDVDLNLHLGSSEADIATFTSAARAVGASIRGDIGRPKRWRGILTQDTVLLAGVTYEGFPIDVYFNTWWGSDEAVKKSIRIDLDGRSWRFVSPTHLCLFKIQFLSEKHTREIQYKHLSDIYSLMNQSKHPVDVEFVSQAVAGLLPPADFRYMAWQDIVSTSDKVPIPETERERRKDSMCWPMVTSLLDVVTCIWVKRI